MNYTPRFDFEDDRKDGVMDKIGNFFIALGPRYVLGALAVVLLILGAIIYGLYPNGDDPQGTVPIVRADVQPFKSQPDDPGGMEIANRDSTIFDAISGEDTDAGVENLLAETDNEEPMSRTELFAGLNTEPQEQDSADVETIASVEESSSDGDMPPQPEAIENELETLARGEDLSEQTTETLAAMQDNAPTQAEESAVQGVEPAAGDMEQVLETAANATEATPPKAEPKPEMTMSDAASLVNQLEPAAGAAPPRGAIPSGSYYVQVASVKSQGGAAGEWSKIAQKYDAALSGMEYRVKEANLGDKGTFYRIQAGPTSKAYATDVCDQMKAVSSGACLVVKD